MHQKPPHFPLMKVESYAICPSLWLAYFTQDNILKFIHIETHEIIAVLCDILGWFITLAKVT
jgi:hypothetical protein